MKRLLSILILFATLRVFGAAGDYVGASVNADGWQLWLEFAGMNTNGTFSLGLGTNNSISGNEKCKVTVVSQGFDDTGSATTLTRTLYGTYRVRFPYTNQAYADVTSNGVTTLVKIALSDYVYSGDSNITVTLLAGLYSTNSVSSAAATAMPVTNNSTLAYPKPIANWSWRGWRVIDEEYMKLRVVGFHTQGRSGRPVRCVEFRVLDSTNGWHTNIVTEATIDREMRDINPVPEYVAAFATNSLPSGLAVCDARVYPWVGDSASVLDSRESDLFEPTAKFCTITNAVNYSRVRAIVSNSGNDSSGVAVGEVYWQTNSSPPAFATIGRAMVAIYGTNSALYSRSGYGGGIVLLQSGSYAYLGSTCTLANGPGVEILITPNSGQTALITNQATDITCTSDADIVRLKNLDVASTTFIVQSQRQFWFENCTIHDMTGARWFDSGTTLPNALVLTDSFITNITNVGLAQSGSDYGFISLMRGNNCTGVNITWLAFTCLGNQYTNSAPISVQIKDAGSSMAASLQGTPTIHAYNSLFNITASGSWGVTYDVTNGLAVVQNVIEYASTTQTGAGGISTSGRRSTNVVIWNNTLMGNRYLYGYNDSGTSTDWKFHWSTKNNVFDWAPIKSDTFGTPSVSRTGNWAVVWGVASYGNAWAHITNLNGTTSFPHEFPGLYSWEHLGEQPTNYWQAVTRGGYDGVNINASPGNYNVTSDSPLLTRNQTDWVLPFDMLGNRRGAFDPPGAYASASPRKGAGFFQ